MNINLKVSILGYRSDLLQPWDSDTPLSRSLPGSEEAVIYLSRELVGLGYQVRVWMNPPKNSPYTLPNSNPRYFPVEDFNSYYHDDEIVVCWRNFPSPESFKSRLRLFWPHDTVGLHRLASKVIESFSGILWLSRWQRLNYLSSQGIWGRISHTIMGNGWSPTLSPVSTKINPYSCIYGSNWSRGLESVLDIWPTVKKNFPDATLAIAYGPNTWSVWTPEKEAAVLERVKSMENLGVTNVGSIDHKELEALYQQTSFWLYPNTEWETFCITAVKAQGGGCIPIVVRRGGLEETVAPFAETVSDLKDWPELLFKNLKNALSITPDDRQKYIEYSKSWFWSETAKRFHDFVTSL